MSEEKNRLLYGFSESLTEPIPLRAGPFSMIYEKGFIRYISYGDNEIIRIVYMALRDKNWGTYPAIIENENIISGEDSFEISYNCRHEENNQTIIPLNFGPEDSKFIVFKKATAPVHIVKIEKDGQSFFPGNAFQEIDQPCIDVSKEDAGTSATLYQPGNYTLTWSDGKMSQTALAAPSIAIPLAGKWDIAFDTSWGGPLHIQTDSLQSWTVFNDSGIKYHSGKGVYTKNFFVKENNLKNTKAILDLGNVLEMASIKINGHQMPVKWNAPFQFNISSYIKPGNNQLEVEVVNLWPNRLIGDAKLPPEKRLTKTNVMKYDMPGADSLLRPSGLLGPVQVMLIANKKAR